MRCQIAIFGAYRADQYADPEGFKNSLGAVLEQFPDEVVVYIADPRTGIVRRSKWPPTISEVIEAAEDHIAHLERMKARRSTIPDRPAPLLLRERPDGYLAQVFVPEGHHRYAGLVAWSDTAERAYWKYGKASDGRQGIWVSHDAWQARSQKMGEG